MAETSTSPPGAPRVVVGAGHNGLVAAARLAQQGVSVRVLEERGVAGGAVRTARPFAHAPALGTSTGAHLLGSMPPEISAALGLELPLIRRDPHCFLPTTTGRYLLFGSDSERFESEFLKFFSRADHRANGRLQAEIAAIREDIAPTWLEAPLGIEETAERCVRAELREVFVDL
ncbi:MAG TPA: NAD(P)-binding protein [Polyangiaceae bacterium]|nr:NAD(P)-binding protein [Polyangiaceae bacterium]